MTMLRMVLDGLVKADMSFRWKLRNSASIGVTASVAATPWEDGPANSQPVGGITDSNANELSYSRYAPTDVSELKASRHS